MLVFGRRPGEYVVIDKRKIIKVVRSESGELRLDIYVPKDVEILRGEIYESNKSKAAI